jgi:hypothetical protein
LPTERALEARREPTPEDGLSEDRPLTIGGNLKRLALVGRYQQTCAWVRR